MDAIKRIFPLQPGTGLTEFAVIGVGVFFAISAVIAAQWLPLN
jgi:hypothetical protein